MSFPSWPKAAQWAALVAVSAAVTGAWMAAGLPAALLIGPMIAGIVFGVNGARLDVPRWSYLGAQAVIGALVASSMSPAILGKFSESAFIFVGAVASTLVGSTAIGWIVSRVGLIPGATAVYGMSPGAASAMVMLSEAHGADKSLVAFMQYSRVLMVAFATTFVAHFWAGTDAHPPGAGWDAPVQWGPLLAVILLGLAGQQAARLVRLHAWGLIGPMVLLSALHATGLISIDLPRWLLAIAYAVLGWHIGLGFRRDELVHAGKALPIVFGAALSLIAFCAFVAWCLTMLVHVDGLTAYLATSPGGVDVAAIIAASTPSVDLSFVLALQSIRLFATVALAPLLIRLVVRHSPHLRRD
ncbi:MAG TPA: AbrB family transcriptional regulator [Usitatibacter sp.]